MTTKQFQVWKNFTEKMKLELELNKDKGDWVPWTNQMLIWNETDYHFNKLKTALFIDKDPDKIRRQAAALANICLFMYNSVDYMKSTQESVRNNETYLESIGYENGENTICPTCEGRGFHNDPPIYCMRCSGKGYIL